MLRLLALAVFILLVWVVAYAAFMMPSDRATKPAPKRDHNEPPECWHQNTEPVMNSGEIVAQVCVDCWEQLPAGFMQRFDMEGNRREHPELVEQQQELSPMELKLAQALTVGLPPAVCTYYQPERPEGAAIGSVWADTNNNGKGWLLDDDGQWKQITPDPAPALRMERGWK